MSDQLFIADVRDGLGPFLGIFLTQRHWQAEDIGLLMSVGGIAGLLATLPAGFITGSRHKRLLLAGVCLAITLTTLLLWFSQKTSVVALASRQRHLRGLCRTADRRDYPRSCQTARL
jgi:sugar phosphate permease